MAGSDFSCPFVIGYGSSPSRCGPPRREAARPDRRPPRFRRRLFARDRVFDLGRATASRIAAPHMSPSTLLTASAPTILWLSRLNSPPHAIAVYASQPPSPTTTQHSLPGVRYDLPGPDFHRLDAPASWRTSNPGDRRAPDVRWIASSLFHRNDAPASCTPPRALYAMRADRLISAQRPPRRACDEKDCAP